MVSIFVNPTVNPNARLGVRPFDETDPIRLWSGASVIEIEAIIRALYRQVLGNAHVMESERLVSLESQLTQGDISVREFVRKLAKSELYRARFFEECPRYRAIELNFKHLLGRAPESYEETTYHSHILDTAGYDAEIDSYIDSEEYDRVFGEDTVPYYRGHKTQTGRQLVGFTHMFQLLRGSSASDKNLISGNVSRLKQAIFTNTPSSIVPPTNILSGWRPLTDANRLVANVLGLKYERATSVQSVSTATPAESELDFDRQRQYQGLQALDKAPIELCPGFSDDEANVVIRAVYRQVLGNAHVMDSERLQIPESQLKRGELSVREFIRCLAKSDLYRSRFFDNCYRYRAVELNFKHLLGRAPSSFEEMKHHSAILDGDGFEADIDSYLDSDEYQHTFGETIVPYYRGYKTQLGQPLIGFTNMLQLLRSASSSDKDPASNNHPQLTRSIIINRPYGIDRPRDVNDILRDVFRPKASSLASIQEAKARSEKMAAEQALRQTIEEQSQQIRRLQQQLADLRPFAVIGATQLKSDWGPSAVSGSLDDSASLQQQVDLQTAQIAALQAQIADARRYAVIGEARLNRWRSRIYRG